MALRFGGHAASPIVSDAATSPLIARIEKAFGDFPIIPNRLGLLSVGRPQSGFVCAAFLKVRLLCQFSEDTNYARGGRV